MKFLFKLTKAWLATRWVWTLCLVMLIGALIWSCGPYLAFGDNRFWHTPSARLLTLCLLILGWGIAMAAGRQASPEQTTESPRQVSRKASRQMQRAFAQARRKLLKTSLYSGRNERWRRRLPWYLVMGPAKAGTTSLLEHSGLAFPINERQFQDQPPQPTQACHWYFAEQAVLLDTGSSYLSQGNAAEKANWRAMLRELQRRRSTALDGLVITVPADILISPQSDAASETAALVRARLLEAQRWLKCRVPVYLVITKADHIKGFEAFFADLTQEELRQGLGFTFQRGETGTCEDTLNRHFEALLQRLDSQLFSRLHHERRVSARTLAVDFPYQFSQASRQVAAFVGKAFAGNRYEPAGLLRGIYFTSAPNWAAPASVPPEEGKNGSAGLSLSDPVSRLGMSRFIHEVFTRSAFAEAGSARPDRREVRRLRRSRRWLYGATGALVVAVTALWVNGFVKNHGRLDQLNRFSQGMHEKSGSLAAEDRAAGMLPLLDNGYRASRVFQGASLIEHSGLFQGSKSEPRLNAGYRQLLERSLLPQIARQLEAQVRLDLSHRERLLGSLRAYLMLGRPEKREAAYLQPRILHAWRLRFASEPDAAGRLDAHVRRLLEQPFRYTLDEELVERARDVLHKTSPAQLAYQKMIQESSSLPEYRLDARLGPNAHALTGIESTIPGLYTRKGYERTLLIKGPRILQALTRDDWVPGRGQQGHVDLAPALAELERLYFHDYANHWSKAVARIGIGSFETASEADQTLEALTSTASPLTHLLVEIRENTRFSSLAAQLGEPPFPASTLEAARDTVENLKPLTVSAALVLPASAAREGMERRS